MRRASSRASERAIVVDGATSAASVQAFARAFARERGASVRDEWCLAIAASEAATNIAKFGTRGTLTLRFVSRPAPAIELCAEDDGPGLTDVARAMIDGVSEGVDVASLERGQAARRGLGTGLGAIRRAVDELEISARPTGGTRLVARRNLAGVR